MYTSLTQSLERFERNRQCWTLFKGRLEDTKWYTTSTVEFYHLFFSPTHWFSQSRSTSNLTEYQAVFVMKLPNLLGNCILRLN